MNCMIRISSTEFGKEVGRYQDAALTQPVVVTRNGRDRTVMISAEEYRRLKRRDRRVVSIEDFTDEDIALIAQSEVPPGYEYLDEELKDWQP
jgi:prevent-host-death family protein